MKNLFEIGQAVEAKVVAISDDTIFIDLGLKSEGFVSKLEFTDENENCTAKIGDKIKVYYLNENNGELHFASKISKTSDISLLESAFKNGIPVEGKVTQEINGGFDVMLGSYRAFCPYSQMGFSKEKASAEYIGETLAFKIQEFKNNGKNIVVSNRIILEEKTSAQLEKISQSLSEGQTVHGIVKSIESFGAFVDLCGFQALLPISEISHARVERVSDILKIGQQIEVKIIKADCKHKKVSVSMKALEADPWEDVARRFPTGAETEGEISRVEVFGIFVNLADGIDGLIHVSKLNVERNANLKKIFKVGEKVSVAIEKLDLEKKRISLSPIFSSQEQENANEYFSLHKNDDSGETYNPFAVLLKKY